MCRPFLALPVSHVDFDNCRCPPFSMVPFSLKWSNMCPVQYWNLLNHIHSPIAYMLMNFWSFGNIWVAFGHFHHVCTVFITSVSAWNCDVTIGLTHFNAAAAAVWRKMESFLLYPFHTYAWMLRMLYPPRSARDPYCICTVYVDFHPDPQPNFESDFMFHVCCG